MTDLTRIRDMSRRNALILGGVGAVVMALTSHAVGATRARGGLLQALDLTSFSSGHMAGILVVVLWLGVLAFIVSWIVVGGRILRLGERLGTAPLVVWTAPLLFAGPLMSRDVYSYLMQGTLSSHGFDPYQVGASAVPGRIFFEVSADWRNTTTPYGPLHMWIGEGVIRLTGDNVTAGVAVYKLISLACFAVLVWSVARVAMALNVRPDVAVWLGVANPLSVIHLIGGMHNEVTMMALVCTGLLAAVRLPVIRGAIAGAALIGAGIALKATAAIALPFMVWILVSRYAGPLGGEDSAGASGHPVRRSLRRVLGDMREGTPRRAATLVVGGTAAVAVAVGMVAVITVASGQTWGWIGEISGNSKVINPLAVPSLLASLLTRPVGLIDENIFFNDILAVLRPVSTAVMALILLVAWVVWRRSVREAFVGTTVAYAAMCLFNAVVLPWYYVSPLALVGLWLRDRRAVFAVVWLTMVASMTFDGSGNNRLYNLLWLLVVGLVMWWLARACLTDRADDGATGPESADGHALGPSHDLAGEMAVERVNGAAGK